MNTKTAAIGVATVLTIGAMMAGGQPTGDVIDTNLPIFGRAVTPEGQGKVYDWAKEGLTFTKVDVVTPASGLTFTPAMGKIAVAMAGQPSGIYETVIDVEFTFKPLPDWTGPERKSRQRGRVQWYVFPTDETPFGIGFGDVNLE